MYNDALLLSGVSFTTCSLCLDSERSFLISRFTAVEKSMLEMEKSMNHRIDSLIGDIKTSFSKEVSDVKTEIKSDLHRLESDVDVLKASYADTVKKQTCLTFLAIFLPMQTWKITLL